MSITSACLSFHWLISQFIIQYLTQVVPWFIFGIKLWFLSISLCWYGITYIEKRYLRMDSKCISLRRVGVVEASELYPKRLLHYHSDIFFIFNTMSPWRHPSNLGWFLKLWVGTQNGPPHDNSSKYVCNMFHRTWVPQWEKKNISLGSLTWMV